MISFTVSSRDDGKTTSHLFLLQHIMLIVPHSALFHNSYGDSVQSCATHCSKKDLVRELYMYRLSVLAVVLRTNMKSKTEWRGSMCQRPVSEPTIRERRKTNCHRTQQQQQQQEKQQQQQYQIIITAVSEKKTSLPLSQICSGRTRCTYELFI